MNVFSIQVLALMVIYSIPSAVVLVIMRRARA